MSLAFRASSQTPRFGVLLEQMNMATALLFQARSSCYDRLASNSTHSALLRASMHMCVAVQAWMCCVYSIAPSAAPYIWDGHFADCLSTFLEPLSVSVRWYGPCRHRCPRQVMKTTSWGCTPTTMVPGQPRKAPARFRLRLSGFLMHLI